MANWEESSSIVFVFFSAASLHPCPFVCLSWTHQYLSCPIPEPEPYILGSDPPSSSDPLSVLDPWWEWSPTLTSWMPYKVTEKNWAFPASQHCLHQCLWARVTGVRNGYSIQQHWAEFLAHPQQIQLIRGPRAQPKALLKTQTPVSETEKGENHQIRIR